VSAHIKNTERSQINDLILHLKFLGKTEQVKPKRSRREVIKIRAEINEIETKKIIQSINKTKSWIFVKINKIDKLLANMNKRRRERI
jgi:GTP-binding protein EngB required for normal cell division